MNRTIKEAEADQRTPRWIIVPQTLKRVYKDDHDPFRTHLADVMAACNVARRPKAPNFLTPYEVI